MTTTTMGDRNQASAVNIVLAIGVAGLINKAKEAIQEKQHTTATTCLNLADQIEHPSRTLQSDTVQHLWDALPADVKDEFSSRAAQSSGINRISSELYVSCRAFAQQLADEGKLTDPRTAPTGKQLVERFMEWLGSGESSRRKQTSAA